VILALTLGILANDPLADAASRVVKLYGAGAGRVEAYGTGILVGPDGRILTVLTGMLQGETITVVFADGRRRPATLTAADPAAGLALLSATGIKTPFFDLSMNRAPETGEVVYAVTNAFNIAAGDEPLSVQRGVIAGRAKLTGRVGVREAPTPDEVLLVDAAISNPGAAGGALVDSNGRLVGLVGRELRNVATQTWVHYAIPTASLARFVSGSGSTKAVAAPPNASPLRRNTDLRGIVPLPDWLDRTPPFVDSVEPGSSAAKAKLQADDLVLFVNDKLVGSVAELQAAFTAAAPDKSIRLTVKRNDALVTVELEGRGR
jgi:S1-C subfamily serine protease